MSGSPKPLSIVIPTYNRSALLTQCLDALRTQTAGIESFDINVVDDHSPDDTPDVLRNAAQSMPNLTWTRQPENRGPAAARNRAASLSTGRLLLFLDDDIVASPDLVETHLRLHDNRGAQHGVVGHVSWLPGLKVTPFMTWVEEHPVLFNYANMTAGPQENIPAAFYTCNLSLARAAFEAAGGFDERFPFPACEDTDLGVRLANEGFSLWYEPGAIAWHARAITLSDLRSRLRQTAPSVELFAQLHPETLLPGSEGHSRPDTPLWRLVRAVKRSLLRLAVQVTPSVGGYDLRSMHYACELGHAQLAGLRDLRRQQRT